MEAKAEANHKCVKEDLDDGSCVKPVMKKSKAAIEVNSLNTTGLDVEAGQAKDPKVAAETIDNARPFQQEAQQPQVALRPKATALEDPLCIKSSPSPRWLTDCSFCSTNIFDQQNVIWTPHPMLNVAVK